MNIEMVSEIKRDDKTWIFNVGTNRFEENPKWLFIYINKFRPDIDAYWFSHSEELTKEIKKLGFQAYTFADKRGFEIQEKAGVLVTNQVKEAFPELLRGAKYLNLWHGVGTKALIERTLSVGLLAKRIAKKYIKFGDVYTTDQMFLATSKPMEEHFKVTHGLTDSQIIRAGYPRCNYKQKFDFSTYDHDLRTQNGLSEDAKIILVAPTYRDKSDIDYMNTAFPDMEKLVAKLKQENILMIFKMHPIIEQSSGFVTIKEHYKDEPNLIFWDNKQDVYEIFDQIDTAIIDYSSIYYDLMAAGVTKFVRYVFDLDIYDQYLNNYLELTTGVVCECFEQLMSTLGGEIDPETKKAEQIKDYFWSYDDEQSFDKIIEFALSYDNNKEEVPTLYSFDIFDTLITRKVNEPRGVFFYVQEMIRKSNLDFPTYFRANYEMTRRQCESNVREYYNKSKLIRNDDRVEIQFSQIFDRMQELYRLNDKQVAALIEWELECEYKNIVAMPEGIEKLKQLAAEGNDVILVSDMYLPEENIRQLLTIVDDELNKFPLYLSSETGYQKMTGDIYTHIFYDLEYKYGKWVHFGDNNHSDGKRAREMGIEAEVHKIAKPNKFESYVVNKLKSYDSFLVAKLLTNRRFDASQALIPEDPEQQVDEMAALTELYDNFAYSYFSLSTVPYLNWLIQDGVEKGLDTLYFISRDGHYLKLMADKIIEINGYDIKTKYIYGSRKAWRVPSYITEIDEEFFSPFGNFSGIDHPSKILNALQMTEEQFLEIFPEFKYIFFNPINKDEVTKIIDASRHSVQYHDFLLAYAKEKRELIQEYLKQEIDFSENFAFVEFWARGYTQSCLTNIINDIDGIDMDVAFYYARSIYGTIGRDIRYNYTNFNLSLVPVEGVFAHTPYDSISEYTRIDGRVEPVMNYVETPSIMHEAVMRMMEKFCEDFYSLELLDRETTERELFDITVAYINRNKKNKLLAETLFAEKHAATLWEDISENEIQVELSDEEAPALTLIDVLKVETLDDKTQSLTVSLERSNVATRFAYKLNTKLKNKFGK